MTKSKEVTTKNTIAAYDGDISQRATEVGRGSENVGANDLAIPRIKLLQPLSPVCTAGAAEYDENARAGMLMNTLTGDLYSSIFLVNLHFSKKFVIWDKRSNTAPWATCETRTEAEDALASAGETEKNFSIKENPVHLVMIINNEGQSEGVALLDMPSTKIKVSQKWNSLINQAEQDGNPRFGCVWKLGVKLEKNTQGTFFTYDLQEIAEGVKYICATQDIYDVALAEYNKFFGKADKAAA